MTLDEVRRLGRIESSFETNRVLRLDRQCEAGAIVWRLREEAVDPPVSKLYDRGSVDEWLAAYAASPDEWGRFRFIGSKVEGKIAGVVTWEYVAWNNTVTLVDIRVQRRRRGHGIGRALVGALKEEVRRLGARGVTVETQINNLPAIYFYRRQGFGIAGFNDHLYSNHDFEDQDVAVFLFWERPDLKQTRRL